MTTDKYTTSANWVASTPMLQKVFEDPKWWDDDGHRMVVAGAQTYAPVLPATILFAITEMHVYDMPVDMPLSMRGAKHVTGYEDASTARTIHPGQSVVLELHMAEPFPGLVIRRDPLTVVVLAETTFIDWEVILRGQTPFGLFRCDVRYKPRLEVRELRFVAPEDWIPRVRRALQTPHPSVSLARNKLINSDVIKVVAECARVREPRSIELNLSDNDLSYICRVFIDECESIKKVDLNHNID